MGSGRSGKFGNTRGAGGGGGGEKTPEPSLHNEMPENDGQTKHMLDDRGGHIPDTPDNRKKLIDLANDDKYYKGVDSRYGNTWHSKKLKDGSQMWSESRNGKIRNGGINKEPVPWDPETGYKRNMPTRNVKIRNKR